MRTVRAFLAGAAFGITAIVGYIFWLAAETERRTAERQNLHPFYDIEGKYREPWSWQPAPDAKVTPTHVDWYA